MPPKGRSFTHSNHSGILCVPTTLSMITFSGQGATSVIAVSTNIAIKTMLSHLRYGFTSSRMRLTMPCRGRLSGGATGFSMATRPVSAARSFPGSIGLMGQK